MALTTALLDIDGTLLDSNDAHAKAWVEALEQVGHPASFEEVREWIGMGGDNLLEQLGLSDEEGPGKEAASLRKEIFAGLLPALRPLPGARELLLRMKAAGLSRVVATSASSEELKGLLERAGIADLVQEATTADDAERSKPDPDIVQAALSRARVSADEALLLGDTPYDLQAATAAGVGFVALRSGGWDFAKVRGTAPLAVYDDPSDLVSRWDESPYVTRRR